MPRIPSQVVITVPTGIPPLSVASNSLVTNLNANFLNGFGPGAFAEANHDHTSSQITDSTAAGRTLLASLNAGTQRADLGLGSRSTTIQAVASVNVSREEDPVGTPRPGIRFLEGSGVSISISNDDAEDRYDVTISANLNDRLVATQHSLTGGGDLSANRTLSLVNDEESPGNSEYYGTNSGGTKGYHPLPTPSGGNVRNVRKVTGTYSATTSDSVILADAPSSGNYTVTLPVSGVSDGQLFTVARTTDAYSGTGVIVDFGFSTEGLDVSDDSRTYIWHSSSGRYYRLDGPNS